MIHKDLQSVLHTVYLHTQEHMPEHTHSSARHACTLPRIYTHACTHRRTHAQSIPLPACLCGSLTVSN